MVLAGRFGAQEPKITHAHRILDADDERERVVQQAREVIDSHRSMLVFRNVISRYKVIIPTSAVVPEMLVGVCQCYC